jgi:diguanylate cyclase (GGDEF)-like protein
MAQDILLMRIVPSFQKFLHYLLASSKFRQQDPDFLSLPLIHEIVYRVFSIITPFSLIPAFLVSWQKQQMLVMAAQGVLGFIVILHAWLLLARNYRVLSPFMMFSVSIALYILAISRGEHFALYWASAFTGAFYMLFERRSARYMNGAWIVLNGAMTFIIFPLEQAANLIGSLACTGLFIEVLFVILNRNEQYLAKLAQHDPLTNAYNRRKMLEDLQQAIVTRNRNQVPASIIIIDVDKFKAINDTFGHQEGDIVLKALSAMVSARLRANDRLYRIGGEEFVAFLAATDLNHAEHVATSLCELIRITPLSTKTPTTISCGVAEARTGDTVDEWIARSDAALYRAKANGRDRVELEASPDNALSLSI